MAKIFAFLKYLNTNISFEKTYNGYILPGVGSFKNAMDVINESGLNEFIVHEVKFIKATLIDYINSIFK